jgi:hypothetical protein
MLVILLQKQCFGSGFGPIHSILLDPDCQSEVIDPGPIHTVAETELFVSALANIGKYFLGTFRCLLKSLLLTCGSVKDHSELITTKPTIGYILGRR